MCLDPFGHVTAGCWHGFDRLAEQRRNSAVSYPVGAPNGPPAWRRYITPPAIPPQAGLYRAWRSFDVCQTSHLDAGSSFKGALSTWSTQVRKIVYHHAPRDVAAQKGGRRTFEFVAFFVEALLPLIEVFDSAQGRPRLLSGAAGAALTHARGCQCRLCWTFSLCRFIPRDRVIGSRHVARR